MRGNLVTQEQRDELEELYKPLMKYLSENLHPHVMVIVQSNSAELLEGQACFNTNEFLLD